MIIYLEMRISKEHAMQKRLAGILLKENKNKMALGVVMGQ
jgi:hypothetical protein